MNQEQRSRWLRFALIGSIFTPAAHLAVLIASGQDPVPTPVSALSRGPLAWLQTGALVLFGAAHVALAVGLDGLDRGRLWRVAQGLLVTAGIGNVYLAWYFAKATDAALYGPGANDPLWIIASLTGVAMGAVQPGLARQARGLAAFTLVMLGIWLWLIPTILLVDESWLGLYERIVGLTYVAWLGGMSYGLLRVGEGRRAA